MKQLHLLFKTGHKIVMGS